MLTHISLQRRRIGFATLFFALGGLVYFQTTGAPFLQTLGMGALFALITFLFAALSVAIMPRYRTTEELAGVLFFAFSLCNAFFPGFDVTEGQTAGILGFCAAYILVEHFLYGPGQHKLPAWTRWKGRSAFTTGAAPEDVWARLAPNPDAPSDYYSGLLADMTPLGGNQYRALWRIGGSNFVVQEIEVQKKVPYRQFAYRYEGLVSEKNRATQSGTWSLTLTPRDDGGTDVEIVETIDRARLGTALMLWFDNVGAQVTESASAVLAGRPDRSTLALMRRYALETS